MPPGFMVTLYNNDARYLEAYMSEFPGYYSCDPPYFPVHPHRRMAVIRLSLGS